MKAADEMVRFCKKQGLIVPGEGVLIALSGGADSVALLCFLAEKQAELGVPFLAACHVHHGIRGAAADQDEAFCRALCEERKIPYTAVYVDAVKSASGSADSLETVARDLRYAALKAQADRLKKESGFEMLIATAHHSDDQAETVLFRLVRGASRKGLSGIPCRRENIIRPLLSLTHADLIADLQKRGQIFCEDETNVDTEYRRNFLRWKILPQLREINPSFGSDLTERTLLWQKEEDYLNESAEKAFAFCKSERGLNVTKLNALHPALQPRVITLFLKEVGTDPTLLLLQNLSALARGEISKWQGNGECHFLRVGDEMLCQRTEPPMEFCREIRSFPTAVSLPGTENQLLFEKRLNVYKNFTEIPKKDLFLCVDYDTIKGRLICRHPLPGDMIRPLGMEGQKSVLRLLREAGETDQSAQKAWVLADAAGVLAFQSERCRRCATRAAVRKETEWVVTLREIQEKE